MKKLSLIFLFTLVCSIVAHAELSQKALNMRSQIKTYISGKGYSPSIDSDGDIAFKVDGESYYVHLQDYRGVVAVAITKYLNNNTELSHGTIDKICWSLGNDYRLVKIYPTSTYQSVKVEVEALYDTASQFNQFFDTNLLIVSIVTDALVERVDSL